MVATGFQHKALAPFSGYKRLPAGCARHGLCQAWVTQDFSAKPTLLAAKGAFNHQAHFAGRLVAGKLPWTGKFVLGGLVLDTIFDATGFQGILVFFTAIRLACMGPASRFNTDLVGEADQRLAIICLSAGVVPTAMTKPLPSTTLCCLYPKGTSNQRPTSPLSSANGLHGQHRAG